MQTSASPRRRKNYSTPKLSKLSQAILNLQYRNTHYCDMFEYRQRKHVESIKLCATCHRQLPLSAFNVIEHRVNITIRSKSCKECKSSYSIFRKLDKTIIERQERGTHVSDLFKHYSEPLGVALASFYKQVATCKNKAAREVAKQLRLRKAEKLNLKREVSFGLPDAKNVTMRVKMQFKKYRKLGKTATYISLANFDAIFGYSVSALHAHLISTAPATVVNLATVDIHIDHVFPVSAYDLFTLSGMRDAYALSNLRLTSGFENSAKSLSDKIAVDLFR